MHPCLKNGTRAREYVYMQDTRTDARVHTNAHRCIVTVNACNAGCSAHCEEAAPSHQEQVLHQCVCAFKYQICAWGAVDGKVQGQIDDKETASDTADEAGLCARGAKGLRRLLGFLCYL